MPVFASFVACVARRRAAGRASNPTLPVIPLRAPGSFFENTPPSAFLLHHIWLETCWRVLKPWAFHSHHPSLPTLTPPLDLHERGRVKRTVMNGAPRQPLLQLPCALLYVSERNFHSGRLIVWNIQTLHSIPGTLRGSCSLSLGELRDQIVPLTRPLSKAVGMICGFPLCALWFRMIVAHAHDPTLSFCLPRGPSVFKAVLFLSFLLPLIWNSMAKGQ